MINRRHVLQGIGGLAMSPLFLRSMAAEAASANNTIIVAILLAGGNDGLNTIVPIPQYGRYLKLRTPATPPKNLTLAYPLDALAPLAFDTNPTIPVSSATQFAFAPGMDPMRTLYATGHLAVIAGVGLPPAETNPMSHTNGQLDWLTGQINVGGSALAGWLGLAVQGAASGVLGPGTSLSGSALVLNTFTSQAAVIQTPIDTFDVRYSVSDNLTNLKSAYTQIHALPASSAYATYDQGVLNAALGDIATVQAIAKAVPATGYPTPTALDYQLRDIARLIIGGAGVRAYYASQGSYDTHSAQAEAQPGLLSALSTSLHNFYTYLQTNGASSNVVVMTMSDFGRRPAANLNFGTDHGGASVSFVLGDPIKGGMYGTYPSLIHFDANQNLKLSVDFRNVLSDLIVAMGGNASTILGQTWPALGFI